MRKIIGIFGQMGNGKSTAAVYLQKELNEKLHYPLGFTTIGFASALRQELSRLTGMSVEYINRYKNDRTHFPPGWNTNIRQALQSLGACVRSIKPRAWIDQTIEYRDYVIIDDGRYINEATAIRDMGGYNILIVKPDAINVCPQHESECDFVPSILWVENNMIMSEPRRVNMPFSTLFDYVILNNGDLDKLKKDIVTMLPSIKTKLNLS